MENPTKKYLKELGKLALEIHEKTSSAADFNDIKLEVQAFYDFIDRSPDSIDLPQYLESWPESTFYKIIIPHRIANSDNPNDVTDFVSAMKKIERKKR